MTHILYNEMYVYVWFICIYHVILVVLVLTNLVLLVKIYCHKPPQFPLSLFSAHPANPLSGAFHHVFSLPESLNSSPPMKPSSLSFEFKPEDYLPNLVDDGNFSYDANQLYRELVSQMSKNSSTAPQTPATTAGQQAV
jgi:hypothetical protein